MRDAKLQLVGDLAERWENSSDGKTWTFTTRPNAKWSDGKPLTAKDAAWTINTIVKFSDGPTSNAAGYVANITKAAAPDDTTLVVTYDTPLANALSKMSSITILPEHVWGPLAAGKGEKLKTFQNNVPIVSAGPFNLERYTKKQIALFKKNPDFYGPKPRIDGFGIRFFATEDPMVAALRAGELDYVNEVPAAALDNVKRAGFNVVETPGLEWKNLIFNSTPEKPKNRELLDPKVRQAFEYAIDRQRIVDTAWLGHARPGTTIVPPALGAGTTRRSSRWHSTSPRPTSCSTRPASGAAPAASGWPTATRCATRSSSRRSSAAAATGPSRSSRPTWPRSGSG